MGGQSERTRDTMPWPRENKTAFIGILYERLKKGKLQCSTFTKDEWGNIKEELKATTTWDYGIERLKGKWNRLRISHRLFTTLIEHTGVTWDPNTNEVHAAEDVWNHFYTVRWMHKYFLKGISIWIFNVKASIHWVCKALMTARDNLKQHVMMEVNGNFVKLGSKDGDYLLNLA
ncbi:hypothetical protein Droror1_Dr00021724 [Drosera rotundifolia]